MRQLAKTYNFYFMSSLFNDVKLRRMQVVWGVTTANRQDLCPYQSLTQQRWFFIIKYEKF